MSGTENNRTLGKTILKLSAIVRFLALFGESKLGCPIEEVASLEARHRER